MILDVENSTSSVSEESAGTGAHTMREMVANMLQTYTDEFPGNILLTVERVRSKEEVAYHLRKPSSSGVYTVFGDDDLASIHWETNSFKYFVRLDQVFFTLRFDNSTGGGLGLFREDAPQDELLHTLKATQYKERTPLAYISTVAYGRSYVMLVEADRRTFNAAEAMEEYLHKLLSKQPTQDKKELTMCIRRLGGGVIVPPQDLSQLFGNLTTTDNISMIDDTQPLYYTMKYLSDDSPVYDERSLYVRYVYNDYLPKDEENVITLSDFYVEWEAMPDRPVGGNYKHISHDSRVDVHSVVCKVRGTATGKDGETLLFRKMDHPAREGFREKLGKTIELGALGANPSDVTISLMYNVTVRSCRYTKG